MNRFLLLLLSVLSLGWALAPLPTAAPDHPSFSITFLDVGQGDAILLLSEGHALVVDAGRKNASVPSRMRALLRGAQVDYVVATHADGDHIGGMEGFLSEHPKTTFFEPGKSHTTSQWLSLMGFLATGNHEISTRLPSTQPRWVGNTQVTLFPPPKPSLGVSLNENGILIGIRMGGWRVLLPGDAGEKREHRLLANQTLRHFLPESDSLSLLAMGHHGSRTSTSSRWLDALQPLAVACSAGYENRYGHPHQETIDRLDARQIPWFCTADEGTLHYRFDSEGLSVQTDEHPLWNNLALSP
ncbi:MBL fold metallo-hydrolase [bacterium]|nr:MBL fold metallo-hydrolase [bacterium]